MGYNLKQGGWCMTPLKRNLKPKLEGGEGLGQSYLWGQRAVLDQGNSQGKGLQVELTWFVRAERGTGEH